MMLLSSVLAPLLTRRFVHACTPDRSRRDRAETRVVVLILLDRLATKQ